MKNRIIALRGVPNAGKSETIKLTRELLITNYCSAIDGYKSFNTDIKVVLTINDVKIGIESQGDPDSRLEESLKYFNSIGCVVIICATRSRGRTVNLVNELRDNYKVIFVEKGKAHNQSEIDAANLEKAKELFQLTAETIGA